MKSNNGHSIPQDEKLSAVERTMQSFNYQSHGLIEILSTAQKAYGYLSEELLSYISKSLHIPLAKVYSVATFYDEFTFDVQASTECLVCTGPTCSAAGANQVLEEVCRHTGTSETGGVSKDGKYRVQRVACLGLCDHAPAVLVNEKAQVKITADKIEAMLRGQAQEPELHICGDPRELTATIGILDPTDLDAHRDAGAFLGLEKAIFYMNPEQVIAEVKESRLSGRGGAGFSTGLKWEFARKARGDTKYVVCNFDESEPGTFKDRLLMEGDPYRVIEGLMLSAYATESKKGYIFVRGEYNKARDIVEEALDELYSEGLMGEKILGSDYSFDVEIRKNAGAYICGEETALFEAIEGHRGYPRKKPPFPTQAGLFGKPTVINNVETLAVVPSLVTHGGEWFHQWGTEMSVGLKLFCLSGHVENPGVVEAPYGLSVRDLIEQFGGGFVGEPQAILIGGAAGGFLHPDNLDIPLTNEDLKGVDLPIGSGAIMVFNHSVDLWEVLQGLAYFFVHEACGQCAPCRIGTNKIYKILERINLGDGKPSDLQHAEKIGHTIMKTCNCGLGMTAANPLLTYLKNFERVF